MLLYLFLIYVNDKNSFDWDLNGFSPDQGIVVTRYKKISQYLPPQYYILWYLPQYYLSIFTNSEKIVSKTNAKLTFLKSEF